MKIPRIYYDGNISIESNLALDALTSRYCLRVLRCQVGDPLIVFNGKGGEFEACVESVKKSIAIIKVIKHLPGISDSPLTIHLGQGISRGERMDYVVQKSVELGVSTITPLFTERCGVKLSADRLIKRQAHWQSVAISACEQSGRCSVPKIERPVLIDDWLTASFHQHGFVCELNVKSGIKTYNDFVPGHALSLLIGPEGGLTKEEVHRAKTSAKFQTLSLGPRTLRTETATVVAMSLLQSQWGDLSSI